jgi:S1-C subfamily serine protease
MVVSRDLFFKCGAHQLSWNTFINPVIIAGAAILAWSLACAQAPDIAIAERAMKSVVSVLPAGSNKDVSAKEPEGSGVAVFDGHYILTALHVFNTVGDIRVRTYDGELVRAQVMGRDKATDLALLKIEHALPVLETGGDPEIGTPVCAIGNAFGLGLSLSCGTVSAVHRSKTGFNPIEDFVQTDAAVNPGASGGALIDQQGRLVGILSAIFTKSADANIGVNFAVSAPLSMRVARALRDTGKLVWNFGGAVLKPYPKKHATGRLGGQIIRVTKGSAADVAGLKLDDIIFSAGDRRVRKPEDFYSAIARLEPGTAVEVSALRDGAEMQTTLTMK